MVNFLLNKCLNTNEQDEQRRFVTIVLVSALLIGATTGFFAIFGVLVGRSIALISSNFFASGLSLLSLLCLLKFKKTKLSSYIVLFAVLFSCFNAMVIANTRAYTLILVLVCPVFSIILTNLFVGSIINILYYIAFTLLCFNNFGTWQAESFTYIAYMQVTIIFSIFFIATAFYESSRRDLQQKLEESNKKLSELAFRDALTGLYNRRYLEDTLLDDTCPSFFALGDIDNFKRVNDKYGHIMGDKILKQVAHCISTTLGIDGQVVRWGGEEFALIFYSNDQQSFLHKLEAIRLAIANMNTPLDTPITLSFGGCQHISGDYKHSLHQADGALYLAKSSGKNCIKFFGETP